MYIYDFYKWWWNRYFEHLEEIKQISENNLLELLQEKINQLEKQMINCGIV